MGEAGGASSGNFAHHPIAQIRGGPRALFLEIPGKLPAASPRSQIMEPNCDMGPQAHGPWALKEARGGIAKRLASPRCWDRLTP